MNTDTAVKATWKLDAAHSEIAFKVKHMMIANVKGAFRKFNATVVSEGEDFSKAKVDVTIDAGSIDTNSTDRDKHLKSADFFDITAHPQITFRGTSLKKLDDDHYQLRGVLAMKGVEKEIALDVEFGGVVKDPYNREKAGFTVTGKINRKEWGLNWNAALEAGGVMVSDEVRISGEVQLIKQNS
jgi:polyisoprenoid-binding protein YceI